MSELSDLLFQAILGKPKPDPVTSPAVDPATKIYEIALRELARAGDPEAPPSARIARAAIRDALVARREAGL